MKHLQHWAIFLSNKANKQLLVNQLLLNKFSEIFSGEEIKKGVLFSAITIKEMMEAEERHNTVEVAILANRQLRNLSGGEQKKALLNFLLETKPDFIIADNPFDNLDIDSQSNLTLLLNDVAKNIQVIQLINRTADHLPFIKNILSVNDKNIVCAYPEIRSYLQSINLDRNFLFLNDIPPADEPLVSIMDPLIKYKDVTVKYEDRVIVKNINWQINSGEFWHLTGPNGSGKTTLLSIITGDNVKGYGQDITLFGKRKGSGESVWDIKQNIGYFTASIIDLFSRYTTVEQMVISGFYDSVGLYTIPSRRQIRLADNWLILINMLPLKKVLFHTLSLGQQRMIVIVRAMVKHPPLLILDEPAVGLDDENVQILVSLINKISAESTMAILYVSHRAEEGLCPGFTFTLTAGENGSTGEAEQK